MSYLIYVEEDTGQVGLTGQCSLLTGEGEQAELQLELHYRSCEMLGLIDRSDG